MQINNLKTVTFDHYVSSDKEPYRQKYHFSATLDDVRKLFNQEETTSALQWNRKIIK